MSFATDVRLKHHSMSSLLLPTTTTNAVPIRSLLLTLLIVLWSFSGAVVRAADWESCPIISVEDPSSTGDALCTRNMKVPLSYDDDESGPTIDLFVKKVPALDTSNPATSRIFLIEGGPGQSGISTEEMVELLRPAMPNLDIYIPDPRGVGKSSPLNCTTFNELNEMGKYLVYPDDNGTLWRECLESIPQIYGSADYLKHFDIANSAKDLMSLIEQTAPEAEADGTTSDQQKQQVFMYTVSYGTQVMQRLLSIYPNARDAIDGIIMDGIVSTGYNYIMDTKDQNANLAGLAGWDACGILSETCRMAFSDVPSTFAMPYMRLSEYEMLCEPLQQIIESLPGGYNYLKEQFANLNSMATMRVFVPPILYRFLRCSDMDVQDMATLLTNLGPVAMKIGAGGEVDHTQMLNVILQANIVLSENYSRHNLTAETRKAQNEAYMFTTFSSVSGTKLHGLWEEMGMLYDPTITDGYGQYLADQSATPPILFVHGTLDPATPFGLLQPWYDRHYKNTPSTFVRVPYGVHAMGNGQNECVMDIQVQFLRNPTGASDIDMSCLVNIADEIADYEGSTDFTKELVSEVMGGTTDSLWPEDVSPLLPPGVHHAAAATAAAEETTPATSGAGLIGDSVSRPLLTVIASFIACVGVM